MPRRRSGEEARGTKRVVEAYEGPSLYNWDAFADQVAYVAVNIRDLADEKGLRLSEVARRAGLSERTIYNILVGGTDPRLSTLLALADTLGVDVADLLVSPLVRRRQTRRSPK